MKRLVIPFIFLALFGLAQVAEWTPVERDVDGTIMVQVPPGEFTMGSTTGDDDESPTTVVTFTEGFWIDKYEVTRAAYQACVNAGVCTATPNNQYSTHDNQPINRVTWYQAATYCQWRGAQLPTEGEWEYAARGPDGLTYAWGNGIDQSKANYGRNVGETTPVGTYPSGASWVGAMDMAGNVWEWTRSRYRDYPYQDTSSRNIAGVPTNVAGYIVLRGGSFNGRTNDLRSAYRGRFAGDGGSISDGFRCLRSSL